MRQLFFCYWLEIWQGLSYYCTDDKLKQVDVQSWYGSFRENITWTNFLQSSEPPSTLHLLESPWLVWTWACGDLLTGWQVIMAAERGTQWELVVGLWSQAWSISLSCWSNCHSIFLFLNFSNFVLVSFFIHYYVSWHFFSFIQQEDVPSDLCIQQCT